MNFFEHQAQARARTAWLVLFFVLAVAGIMAALYAAVSFGLSMATTAETRQGLPPTPAPFWQPELALWVSIIVLVIVGVGSLIKMGQLAAGGGAVARMLGGREIAMDTHDPAERRLKNVVEEMSIAAGIPVPAVYVLDEEPGMNAFAAGRRPEDAAVAVTRGLLDRLNRDELQGVVAHEFSHILNGDMRLNLRLMGVIYGILVISIIGRLLLHSSRFVGGSSRRSSGRGGGQVGLVLIVGGLAAYVIGYIGVFFGRLIQSAVSRQREFLADASAVQFTRNPEGLAGALKRLGAASMHGRLQHPRAEEASHLFFAEGVSSWSSPFATHPPLVERILRIDPSFDGDFTRWADRAPAEAPPSRPDGPRRTVRPPMVPVAALEATTPQFTDRMGQVEPVALTYAHELLATLPSALQDALRHPEAATAAVLALLLETDDAALAGRQLGLIQERLGPDRADQVRLLRPAALLLGAVDRIPYAEVALGALRHMEAGAYPAFRDTVVELVRLDGRVSLFEYSFMRAVVRRLDAIFDPASLERGTGRLRLDGAAREGAAVLGALARLGGDSEEEAGAAFGTARAQLAGCDDWTLPPREATRLEEVDAGLSRLAHLAPMDKEAFVNACAACVFHDGVMRVQESELLRAIAALLDCPSPPWMASSSTPTAIPT